MRDFVWWSGLTVREARLGIDIARLVKRIEDGIDYWAAPGSRATAIPASAHLLPIYDEYVNAYRDRGLLFTRTAPAEALFLHYLIVDGTYAGTWKPVADGSSAIATSARGRLSGAQKAAIDQAARRYAAFQAS